MAHPCNCFSSCPRARKACRVCKDFSMWQPRADSAVFNCFEQSGLPGLEEVGKKDANVFYRIFFFLLFLACMGIGGFLISREVKKTALQPLALNTDPNEIYTGNIAFPGLTVLPPGSFKSEAMLDLIILYGDTGRGNIQEAPDGQPWTPKLVNEMLIDASEICDMHVGYLKKHIDLDEPGLVLSDDGLADVIKEYSVNAQDSPNDEHIKNKIIPYLKAGMTTAEESFSACGLNGKKINCSRIFHSSITERGSSFTFNGIPEAAIRNNGSMAALLSHPHSEDVLKAWKDLNFDKKGIFHYPLINWTSISLNDSIPIPVPFRQKVPGLPTGVEFMAMFDENDFTCRQTEGSGFMVVIHNPLEFPDAARYGIALPLGYEISISITPIVKQADEDIRLLNKNIRGCYFSNDSVLTYYSKYTQTRCQMECLAKKIFQKCKCKSMVAPGEVNSRLCSPVDLDCVEDIEASLQGKGLDRECSECLVDCVSITYKVDTISQIPISERRQAKLRRRLNKTNGTQFSIVRAFIGTPKVLGLTAALTYSPTEAVGVFGGNAGITNGVSIIVVVKAFFKFCMLLLLPFLAATIHWFIPILKKLVDWVRVKFAFLFNKRNGKVLPEEFDLEAQQPRAEVEESEADTEIGTSNISNSIDNSEAEPEVVINPCRRRSSTTPSLDEFWREV